MKAKRYRVCVTVENVRTGRKFRTWVNHIDAPDVFEAGKKAAEMVSRYYPKAVISTGTVRRDRAEEKRIQREVMAAGAL